MGKFLIFCQIQLKFCSWLYKKRWHTSWKFQFEKTSYKKVIGKKRVTNLYEMNSTHMIYFIYTTNLNVKEFQSSTFQFGNEQIYKAESFGMHSFALAMNQFVFVTSNVNWWLILDSMRTTIYCRHYAQSLIRTYDISRSWAP